MNEKSRIFKNLAQSIPDDIQKEVDLSFAIADRIESLLNEKGMTQKDLAIRLGKKESEVSKWLRGTHNFTTQTIAKLSAAFGENIVTVSSQHKGMAESTYIFMSLGQERTITIDRSDSREKLNYKTSQDDFQIHFVRDRGIN